MQCGRRIPSKVARLSRSLLTRTQWSKCGRVGLGGCQIAAKSQMAGRSMFWLEKHGKSVFVRVQQQQNRWFSEQGLPPHHKVILPNLSPTMDAGTIVSWEKDEGDRINEGEVLAMIETDKATMEMETPEEGYLAKILLPAGTKDVAVKTFICIIVEDEGDVAAFKDYVPEQAGLGDVTEPAPKVEEPAVPPKVKEPAKPVEPKPAPAPTPTPASAAEPSSKRIFASPVARRLAAEKGIDLATITGTGPRGRITLEDVEKASVTVAAPIPVATAAPTPMPASVPSADGLFTDVELSSMRKTIAKRLSESKQTVPHYYLSVDIIMDEALRLRKELNDLGKDEYKLSVNDFIIKATSLSLKKIPECNSSWMGDFIRTYHNVDVSVAVSTDGGLITPIVTDADKKGLAAISSDVRTLAEKARDKKLQPHEFVGGTFTISNLGMFGIKNFSAVINPPQSCILAIGATEKRLIADEDSEQGFRVANVMSVTMSCDHRVVDGAVGAQWLQHFKNFLEKPTTMLL